MALSQTVIKETPRKRPRVPPTSATMVEEGYRSSSFSTEVYLEQRKDKVIAGIERGRDSSPVELVLKVVARLSTSSHQLDYLKFFIFHLVVELLKFPEEDS